MFTTAGFTLETSVATSGVPGSTGGVGSGGAADAIGGALLAAVSYASGVEPEVAGKPNRPMVQLVRERFGVIEVMVGDRAETDGTLAHRLGARFALVLSGVTEPGQLPVVPEPAAVAADLAALVPA